MSASTAYILATGAALVVIATWAPVVRVLRVAAMRMHQRRRIVYPLAAIWILATSAAITAGVCVILGTETIGGPDRPTICGGGDPLNICRPIVDRSGLATPQAVHAGYVLAGMALLGLAADAVLLGCMLLRRSDSHSRAGSRGRPHPEVSDNTSRSTGTHHMTEEALLTLDPPQPRPTGRR